VFVGGGGGFSSIFKPPLSLYSVNLWWAGGIFGFFGHQFSYFGHFFCGFFSTLCFCSLFTFFWGCWGSLFPNCCVPRFESPTCEQQLWGFFGFFCFFCFFCFPGIFSPFVVGGLLHCVPFFVFFYLPPTPHPKTFFIGLVGLWDSLPLLFLGFFLWVLVRFVVFFFWFLFGPLFPNPPLLILLPGTPLFLSPNLSPPPKKPCFVARPNPPLFCATTTFGGGIVEGIKPGSPLCLVIPQLFSLFFFSRCCFWFFLLVTRSPMVPPGFFLGFLFIFFFLGFVFFFFGVGVLGGGPPPAPVP